MADDEQGTYELAMPFVTVASRGGPHDDDAYVCGWEMGQLDANLRMIKAVGSGITLSATMHAANLPQADLIAMRHGFTGSVILSDDEQWATVAYTASGDPLA